MPAPSAVTMSHTAKPVATVIAGRNTLSSAVPNCASIAVSRANMLTSAEARLTARAALITGLW